MFPSGTVFASPKLSDTAGIAVREGSLQPERAVAAHLAYVSGPFVAQFCLQLGNTGLERHYLIGGLADTSPVFPPVQDFEDVFEGKQCLIQFAC